MTTKLILILALVTLAVIITAGGCLMVFFMNVFGWKDKGGVIVVNSTESSPDYVDEMFMSSESGVIMTPDEDEMIDGMFPDVIDDDIKLKLILKALLLLKSIEDEYPDHVNTLLPSHDEMTDELKLKLILKAILLLSEKPLDSMFAGHVVADLKLTLILKAILILKESRVDFGLETDVNKLQLTLIRKALEILKTYKGNFVDTVFHTKNTLHLKLKLTLLALHLSKNSHRQARDVLDFKPIKRGHGSGNGQTRPSVRVRIDNGGLIGDDVDMTTESPEQTKPKTREPFGSEKDVLKLFKLLKAGLAKVHHKKGY